MVSEIFSILLSMFPFIELRGGIPLAIASGFSPINAFILCTLANIIIIFPIFLFLDFLHFRLLGIKFYKKISDSVIERTRKKAEKMKDSMKNLGFAALCLFVAIPLPMTGAWTGALIAWLLGLKRWKAFLAIAFGVIIAGILVTLISTGLINAYWILNSK